MRMAWPIGAVAAAAAGWVAYDWYGARDQVLSTPPERSSSDYVPDASDSTVVANLLLPYPVLEEALNDLGAALNDSTTGREKVAEIAGVDLVARWSIDHAVDGRIAVSAEAGRLRISLPGRFAGTVGLTGDVARTLGLDARRVDGSFVVAATAGVEIGEDFCPALVPGKVAFHWQREARVELVGRTRVFGMRVGPIHYAFGHQIEDQIRDALARALRDQRDAIPCAPVHAELAEIWRPHSFPVDIPGMARLHVNLEPRALGVSDLLVEEDGLRMVAQLDARAEVSDSPADDDPIDFPSNSGASAEEGRIDLAVPLSLGYGTIRSAAMTALGNSPLVLETEAGEIVVEVANLDIYPSGDRLAVGIDFSAEMPRRLFDAGGTLWLTARPVISEDGAGIALRDIEVTRQLDSAVWSLATAAFEDRIRAALAQAAVIDLGDQRAAAIAAIEAAAAEAGSRGGLDLDLRTRNLALEEITIAADRLVVEAIYAAKLEATARRIDF